MHDGAHGIFQKVSLFIWRDSRFSDLEVSIAAIIDCVSGSKTALLRLDPNDVSSLDNVDEVCISFVVPFQILELISLVAGWCIISILSSHTVFILGSYFVIFD